MAGTREFEFIVGPETSTQPTVGTPSSDDDLLTRGYADDRYTQGGAAAADVAAIKAITEAERQDGDVILAMSTNVLYAFDAGSSATGDDDIVLTPDAGTGRWLRITLLPGTSISQFDDASPLTSKGDIVVHDGSNNVRLGIGANGTIPIADSGETTGIKWATVPGGIGEINYVDNYGAEVDTTGWSTYADAAGSTPVDGTGGSANITWTRQSSTILRENQSFKLTKDAADRQGEGVSYPITIKTQDTNKKLKIQFDFKSDEDAAYASGDVGIYIYDVTNATLITPNDTDLVVGQNIWQTSFDSTDSLSYRLIFHIATTNASAYDLYFDNIIVGPGSPSQGAAISGYTSFTPVVSGVTGHSSTGSTAYWFREGENITIVYNIVFPTIFTAGSPLTLDWPSDLSAYTPDTSKMPTQDNSTLWIPLYTCMLHDVGTATYEGQVFMNSDGDFQIYAPADDAGTGGAYVGGAGAVSATIPFTWANNDRVSLIAKVPVTDWDGQGIVPMLAQDNLRKWTSYTPTCSWTTNTTVTGLWRQVGDEMKGRIKIALSGAPDAVALTFDIPSGYDIDFTKIFYNDSDPSQSIVGLGTITDVGTAGYVCYVHLSAGGTDTNTLIVKYSTDNGTANTTHTSVTSTAPMTFANTDSVVLSFSVPIVQFDGTQNSLVGYAKSQNGNLGLIDHWEGSTSTTFTFDGSGGTSSSVTLTYERTGKFVILHIPQVVAIAGTGSTTFSSDTAIDSWARPSSAVQYIDVPIGRDANASDTSNDFIMAINTDGTIDIFRDANLTAFTNSASAGNQANFTATYFIDQ